MNVTHYLVSWYEDYTHDYGLNTVDEYFVIFNDRGLVFNVNKRTKEQHAFFCEKPRTKYFLGCGNPITALVDEVMLPQELISQCYEIASIKERLEKLTRSVVIPLTGLTCEDTTVSSRYPDMAII